MIAASIFTTVVGTASLLFGMFLSFSAGMEMSRNGGDVPPLGSPGQKRLSFYSGAAFISLFCGIGLLLLRSD